MVAPCILLSCSRLHSPLRLQGTSEACGRRGRAPRTGRPPSFRRIGTAAASADSSLFSPSVPLHSPSQILRERVKACYKEAGVNHLQVRRGKCSGDGRGRKTDVPRAAPSSQPRLSHTLYFSLHSFHHTTTGLQGRRGRVPGRHQGRRRDGPAERGPAGGPGVKRERERERAVERGWVRDRESVCVCCAWVPLETGAPFLLLYTRKRAHSRRGKEKRERAAAASSLIIHHPLLITPSLPPPFTRPPPAAPPAPGPPSPARAPGRGARRVRGRSHPGPPSGAEGRAGRRTDR